MKTLLPFIFVMMVFSALSQTFTVDDLDYSSYPKMRARFYVFDKDGNQITNWNINDFEVTENEKVRQVTDVYCKVKTEPVKISSVLTIDVSGSMTWENRLDIAKQAASVWVRAMPKGFSECAVTSFENDNLYIQDFTTDEGILIQKINSLTAGGGTRFNAAFLDPVAGGLLVLENAKYKKVMILITDGISSGSQAEIINKANTIGATVYCVTLGCSCPEILKKISEDTGGMWFENITTSAEATNIYLTILATTQKNEACIIEWKSGFKQCTDHDVELAIEIPKMGLLAEKDYLLPQKAMAKVVFSPAGVYFQNKDIGVQADTTIYFKAVNQDLDVTDIISDNPAFDINPKVFSILKGETQELTLSYTPEDSSYNMAKFEFVVNECIINYYSSGGFLGQTANERTLKVTHPNGGEVFVAGSDTVVTWEGVLENDEMTIEFSSDNGGTWLPLTDKALDFTYPWKIDNNIVSSECLISVKQNLVSENDQNSGSIEWTKSFGGTDDEAAYCIQSTLDGGYIVAGYSESLDGDVIENNGLSDCWILKLDGLGNIQWQQCLGGSGHDKAFSVQQTFNGGYIVAGYTSSKDGDVTNNNGDYDYWIIKLDVSGVIQWQYTFGGSRFDKANSVKQTKDGGFIIAGNSNSNEVDNTPNSEYDYWVVKLDNAGNLEWTKSLGGSYMDIATSIQQTDDDGYIVGGYTYSHDIDVFGNKGWSDYWVVKLDEIGEVEWKKCMGGSAEEEARSILQTKDRGFIIAGYSSSQDGDVFGNHGDNDYWVVKLDSLGIIQWQQCLGGSEQDESYSIVQTKDEGYIIAGFTVSNDGDITNLRGDYDYWVVKLDKYGKKSWQKCYGGSRFEVAYSIQQTIDEGYIVVGQSYSTDRDVSGNHGEGDLWVVKLYPDKIYTQADTSDAVFSIVKPILECHDIDMKQAIVGSPKDSIITDFISNVGLWPCRIDNIYFTGADANFFNVNNPYPVYTVPENSVQWTEIEFSPNQARHYEAQLVIVTQADTITQKIIGEGIEPHIIVVNEYIDFGKIYINETKDSLDAVTIKNVGDMPVTISKTEHIYPNATDFTTIEGAGPFTLNPGDVHVMDLSFTARTIGRTSGQLMFHHDKPGSPNKVTLFAEGYSSNTTNIKDIVFAKQPINISNDSTLIKYFENTGIYENKIDTIFLRDDDVDQFKIVKPETSFYLLADSVHDLQITFLPTSEGYKQTKLYMVCQADTIVKNVIGQGVEAHIVVVNEDIDFGRVYMGSTRDTLDAVTITNVGTMPIQITQTEHADPNATDFTTTDGAGPFTLNPGDTCRMDLAYTANNLGKTEGLLLFHHDEQGSPHQVRLLAEGYALNTTEIDHITFANQAIGIANDSTISDYFQNNGDYSNVIDNVYLANNDADQFEIKNLTLPFNLDKDGKLDLEITFLPTSIGNKQTNLYMVCQSDTKVVNIVGRSVSEDMEIITNSIDYGSIDFGQRVDSSHIPILTNTGTEDLILSQITLQGANAIDFDPGNGFSGVSLASGDTLFVDLDFYPQTLGSKTAFIEIMNNITANPVIIDVTGEAIDINNPSISIIIPNLEAKIGEIIEVPIFLKDATYLNLLEADGLSAEIEFNSSVMIPVNQPYESSFLSGFMKTEEFSVMKNVGDTLATIPFKIMLGNKEVSSIEFGSIMHNDDKLSIETASGSIKLLDLCEQGGKRLLNPEGKVGIASLSPNPAEDKLQIILDLSEKGTTTLEIYNSLGKLEKVLIDENIQSPGERNINENIKDLPSGKYSIILKTPTYKQSMKFIIAR